MTKVVTLRLKERELGFIESLSKKEGYRSSAARKLISYGWTYFTLRKYKKGVISIGKCSGWG